MMRNNRRDDGCHQSCKHTATEPNGTENKLEGVRHTLGDDRPLPKDRTGEKQWNEKSKRNLENAASNKGEGGEQAHDENVVPVSADGFTQIQGWFDRAKLQNDARPCGPIQSWLQCLDKRFHVPWTEPENSVVTLLIPEGEQKTLFAERRSGFQCNNLALSVQSPSLVNSRLSGILTNCMKVPSVLSTVFS